MKITKIFFTTLTFFLLIISFGFINNNVYAASDSDSVTVEVTAPPNYTLSVSKLGTGDGTVTSNPSGISCLSDCSEPYASGTSVTLTATAASGSSFTGWGGSCSGTGSCTVSMTSAKSVTATFTVNNYTLSVTKSGSGTVTSSSPLGIISCGTDCSELLASGTSVTLTASPATNYQFSGWGGSCNSSGQVTMTSDKTCTATFTYVPDPIYYTLSVSKTGLGTVTSSPLVGISCGTDCSESYLSGTSITLSASPSTNYQFSSWGGSCSGTGSCTVSMTSAKSVTATFTAIPPGYTVTGVAGSGGSISPTSRSVASGDTTSFTITPNNIFTHIASVTGCNGSLSENTYTTGAIYADCTVTATFMYGSLSASNCTILPTGTTCNTDLSWSTTNPIGTSAVTTPTGITVKLANTSTATYPVSEGSRDFYLYNSGKLLATATAVATKTITSNTLTVSKSGTGSGTVTGTGISCGSDCSESYASGTSVTLTATPTSGTFTSWTGCTTSSSNSCTVLMNSAKSVIATFTIIPSSTPNISATSCTVPSGASTCPSIISWSAPTYPSLNVYPFKISPVMELIQFPGSNVGSKTWTVNYGANSFSLFLSPPSTFIATTNVNISCVPGSTWNGSVCGPVILTVPTITSDTINYYTDRLATFTFVSNDTGTSKIKYGVDWNMDGSVDLWLPSSSYVDLGTPQSTTYSWSTIGAKTFQAKVRNELGGESGWKQFSLTVGIQPELPNVEEFSGTSLSGSSSTSVSVEYNEEINITWNVTGATSCTLVGDGVSESETSGSITTPPLQKTTVFTLSCTGPGGPIERSISAVVGGINIKFEER